ncbi:hypothetical protein [Streptomyces sp. NBC_01435]|uniref:hypothetical protein n=1 Tax=Streptomyces sp. NBC_01435 TaxID=2903865 RepID=UPI002E37A2A3|nr:hypothetical protein [Streptomyces sp. NBC_01435]
MHALTKSEIAAFLMCLQLASEEEYRSISWKEQAGLFGLSRDVHDAMQALEAYRLIKDDVLGEATSRLQRLASWTRASFIPMRAGY